MKLSYVIWHFRIFWGGAEVSKSSLHFTCVDRRKIKLFLCYMLISHALALTNLMKIGRLHFRYPKKCPSKPNRRLQGPYSQTQADRVTHRHTPKSKVETLSRIRRPVAGACRRPAWGAYASNHPRPTFTVKGAYSRRSSALLHRWTVQPTPKGWAECQPPWIPSTLIGPHLTLKVLSHWGNSPVCRLFWGDVFIFIVQGGGCH